MATTNTISPSMARAKALRYLQTMLAKKVNFNAAITKVDKSYPQVGKRQVIADLHLANATKKLNQAKA